MVSFLSWSCRTGLTVYDLQRPFLTLNQSNTSTTIPTTTTTSTSVKYSYVTLDIEISRSTFELLIKNVLV